MAKRTKTEVATEPVGETATAPVTVAEPVVEAAAAEPCDPATCAKCAALEAQIAAHEQTIAELRAIVPPPKKFYQPQ